ncbi:MAG TPA: HlyD family efflux transporter periplasmic adaptor subunit [Longimicrobiales bacterium]|nr:HlyD family efflux transporter periplasmic adaptor subunit [Longimicrobiales bacterium]
MRMTRRGWIVGGVLLAGGASAWLAMRSEPVPVDVGVVARARLRVTVDEDGQTRVRERYLLSSPVAGEMVRLECEPGDFVSEGEVLARIYPLQLDTRTRAEAASRLAAAEASHAAASAGVTQAEVVRDEARRYLERLERVDVEGFIAQERMDRARAAARQGELGLEQARRLADAALHEVQAARAAVLETMGESGLEPIVLRAPAAGRVLRVYEECERAVAPGTPVLELGDTEDLEVVVDVLSEDVGLLRTGATALVTVGPAGDTLVGTIDAIEPAAFTKVSPLGVEEQRVNVIVGFHGELPVLGDRFRVEAALVVWESDDALTVPVGALFRSDGGWAVFTVENGRARRRPVEIGHRGRGAAEVLAGVDEGTSVILYPPDDVADGVRVRAQPSGQGG